MGTSVDTQIASIFMAIENVKNTRNITARGEFKNISNWHIKLVINSIIVLPVLKTTATASQLSQYTV